MPEDFLIARNPEEGTSLPYLLRIPLGPEGIVLKARETWPRTAKVYCHRAVGWPRDPEILERVPVRSCVRRGAAIDLVLGRGRENRSQFVLTRVRGGREAIFWQTARTTRQARPAVTLPTARAAGVTDLPIIVDSHERYAWKFTHQQATTTVRGLSAGDYAVELHGRVVASVERKSLTDLVSTLTGGRMRYLLAALADLPRAAVVVEDRYSQVFQLERVRPALVADGLAECHARFPQVPIMFCETRALAQEWTYRFLAASLREAAEEQGGDARVADLPAATPAPPARIRAWARAQGLEVSDRGRIPADVVAAFDRRND
ncbi:Lsr2 family DNA-binding protein [Ornithinicoccus hortensis]|uniref:ERCC4 domain-containing protein n=1 Tax=Ornithinicoccus hortensis TaxID=82346 RepID=A0A542YUA4_9MICO|nr:histone-like nucleoid-structuring protein Lsr2 [Ornithinicoccus hortensis]TQL51534.1 ERCC4 domain-containing protein [Ornithinicoccus hortensis]